MEEQKALIELLNHSAVAGISSSPLGLGIAIANRSSYLSITELDLYYRTEVQQHVFNCFH